MRTKLFLQGSYVLPVVCHSFESLWINGFHRPLHMVLSLYIRSLTVLITVTGVMKERAHTEKRLKPPARRNWNQSFLSGCQECCHKATANCFIHQSTNHRTLLKCVPTQQTRQLHERHYTRRHTAYGTNVYRHSKRHKSMERLTQVPRQITQTHQSTQIYTMP